jgi:hypothetical protein
MATMGSMAFWKGWVTTLHTFFYGEAPMTEGSPFADERKVRLEAVADAARPLIDSAAGPDYSERLARLRAAFRHLDALPTESKP